MMGLLGGVFGLREKIMLAGSAMLLIALVAFTFFHFFTVGLLKHTIKEQVDTIAELTQENMELTAVNLRMSRSIDVQNAKIQEMVKAQQEASAAAQTAIDAAKRQTSEWRVAYTKILSTPRVIKEDCAAFEDKMQQYLNLRAGEGKP